MIHQNFSREILTLGTTKRAVQRRKGQEMNDLWKTSKTNKQFMELLFFMEKYVQNVAYPNIGALSKYKNK